VRIIHWIFAVCLFTSSFDLLLNFNLGGQVRLAQLLTILIIFAAVARMLQDGRILWPRGGTALVLWVFVQLMFVPLSGMMRIGAIFFSLLAFTVVGLFAILQVYGQSPFIESLMRLYMASFVFVGAFGLLQFATSALGFPPLLVQMWIVHGRFPRISGFSYEPSFYATYMLMGWIMLVELRRNGARIAAGRFWKWATIGVGLSLFLSTSKTGWVVMLVELLARLAPPIWRGFRSAIEQFKNGTMVLALPRTSTVIKLLVGTVSIVTLGFFLFSIIDPTIFVSGTGLANTPAHSYIERTNSTLATWEAFKEHPFIGRSLGGVPIYIASRDGIVITGMDQLRTYWGFPVLLDVLVASGVFGFIPFLIFSYTGTFGALKLSKRFWPQEKARWLRALGRAMIFEWMMLMADQNVLRTYVWFHLSILAAVAYHLEFGPPLAVAVPRLRPLTDVSLLPVSQPSAASMGLPEGSST